MNINRRQFVGAAAATAASFPCCAFAQERRRVKIDRIDVFPLRYPLTGYFKFFTGPHGSSGRAAVIIKITADDGTVGWGQSIPIAKWSYETLETATVVLRDYYAPVLIGRDPTDIDGALAAMDQAVAPGFHHRHADHSRRRRHCAARSDRQASRPIAGTNVGPRARWANHA